MKLKYSRLSNKMDAASVHFRRTMENKIYTMYSRNLTDDTSIAPFSVEATRTQETCNGGSVVRQNAFFPVEYGRFLD